jgi:hypothetical protein
MPAFQEETVMLPKGLYDALPWLYMALGALSAALLASDLKYLPSLLFVLAGMLVLAFRHFHGAPRVDLSAKTVRRHSPRVH